MRNLVLALLGLALGVTGWPAAQKKQEEPVTQVLALPKEPPQAVTVDTNRLAFLVSPLSTKGLLSQQARDAVKGLLEQAKGATVVRLRAFVAGSGDTRRVNMIVSEVFTQRRLPVPVVTTVQVGALATAGAQVVMEATMASRKPVNPNGLALVPAQAAEESGLAARMVPLARKAIPKLEGALMEAGLDGKDVVRATCFVSSVEDVGDVRNLLVASFPKAVLNLVQPERAPSHAAVACEAVARLRAGPVKAIAPPSAVALVRAPRVVLAGSQMAFGYDEENARLAFQRLGKTLEQQSSSLRGVVSVNIYGMSRPIGERALKIGAGFFDPAGPPAATVITCVGLPALDASFALEVVALER